MGEPLPPSGVAAVVRIPGISLVGHGGVRTKGQGRSQRRSYR